MMKKKLKRGREILKIKPKVLQKNKKSPTLTLRQEIANLRAELLREREEKNKLLQDYKKQLTVANSKVTKLEKLVVKKGAVPLTKEPAKNKTLSPPLKLKKPKLTKPQKVQNYRQELREKGQG